MVRIFLLLLLLASTALKAQELTWEWLGPESDPEFNSTAPCPNGMGLVSAFYVDPLQPEFLLAGSNTGGLFRSMDGGKHWVNVSDASMPIVTGISGIVSSPVDPNRFYAGTGTSSYDREYGIGVWTSSDRGETWLPTGLEFRPWEKGGELVSIKKLLIHPADPDILYALAKTSTEARVYRSEDGGQNWDIIFKREGGFFFDIEFNPRDPETIYLGGRGLWISTDDGRTWRKSNMESPEGEVIHRVAISVHPGITSHLWTLYETGGKRGIVLAHSGDEGKTWKTMATHPSGVVTVGQWKMEFEVSRLDTCTFYAGGVYMHRSQNSGRNFHRISSTQITSPKWMHVDVRSMQVFEGNSADIIYSGHDGGLSVSYDGGESWHNLSGTGLGITQFWGITYDHGKNRVYGGTQDLGVLKFEDSSWRNLEVYGDVYDGLVKNGSSDTMLILTNSGAPGMLRSFTGGNSWRFSSQPLRRGKNDRPLAYDPGNPETVYVGYHDLLVSNDFGAQWDKLTDFSELYDVESWLSLSALAVAPSRPDILYAAYQGAAWNDKPKGRLFRSTDKGKSWEDISMNLVGVRWAGITDIKVSPDDPNTLWVSVDGFWGEPGGEMFKVFLSRDGGLSWENVSAGLPNFPVNCLLLLPEKNILIAGTDAGAYYSPWPGSDWKVLGKELPRAIVSDLETNPGNTILLASTFGRGLYSLDLSKSFLSKDKKKERKQRKKRKQRNTNWEKERKGN